MKIFNHNVDYMIIILYFCIANKQINFMDLQINVFKLLIGCNKPVFRHPVCDLQCNFSYETLFEAFKLLYGNKCLFQFNII